LFSRFGVYSIVRDGKRRLRGLGGEGYGKLNRGKEEEEEKEFVACLVL